MCIKFMSTSFHVINVNFLSLTRNDLQMYDG